MKKTFLTLGVLGAILLAPLFFTTAGCGSDKPADDTLKEDSPVVETGIPKSYAMLPADMANQSQEAADTFSWKSFIALNWPALSGSCTADTTKTILSGGGPTVWETYLSDEQVFVAPSSQPASWCGGANANAAQNVPQKVLELGQKTGVTRFISLTSKIDEELPTHAVDEAFGGPLVDQNGRFARYEVRMNQDEYNYIMAETLWTKSGQVGKDILFPAGPSQYGSAGAMEVKAAWKVMGAGDDTTKFYTIRAIVYNSESGEPSPGTNPVTLGLVGLHIAHKTATQNNWVWSTFEHVENLTKSFYNPASNAAPNQPVPNWQTAVELKPDGSPANLPTQVTRVNPVDDPFADGINTYFQAMLDGSVWENYELISTQWFQFEAVAPAYLANSVMETYLQGPSPATYGDYPLLNGEVYFTDPRYKPFSTGSSSSCMGCHYIAKSTAGKRSDFSFIMGEAQ